MPGLQSAPIRLQCLVVDDDEDDALLIRRYLEEHGGFDVSVRWAADCGRAATLLRDEHFDICLVDYRIGPESGIDFLRTAASVAPDVLTILLTGFPASGVAFEASQTGAADFFSKDRLSSGALARSIRFALANQKKTMILRERQDQLERANRALDDQKVLLQIALDHTKHGIAMFDKENRLIAGNARYLEIYGFSTDIVHPGVTIDEIIGHSISLGNYSDVEAERVLAERKVQIDTPSPSTYHQCLTDGRTIAVSHVPVAGGGSVTTCEDITDVLDREQRTAALARSAALADAESAAKSKFLSNMSHELRTPLNAMMGFSEAMRSELFGPLGHENYKDYVEHVHEAAQNLLSLVDRVLEMSVIEGARLELEEDTFRAADLILAVAAAYEDAARNKNIVLRTGEDEADLRLLADRGKVAQAVENIVDNALKFSLPGGIVVISQRRADNGDWILSVSNTGKGIDAAAIAEILSPFGQQEGAFARHNHGAGLGLPIAQGLVRLHGGEISIESGPDVGSTVSIRLPAHRVFGAAGRPTAAIAGGPEQRSSMPESADARKPSAAARGTMQVAGGRRRGGES